MVALQELADRAGDRTDEPARIGSDASEPRSRGGIGAEVDALSTRDTAAVELELSAVVAGPAHSVEPATIRAEGAHAQQIRKGGDRSVAFVVGIPDPKAIEHVPTRHRGRDRADEQPAVGRPSMDRTGERAQRSGAIGSSRLA